MTTHRLYVSSPLAEGATVACAPDQAHHMRHVLRLADGAALEVFNGTHGTWNATLRCLGKRDAILELGACLAVQRTVPDLWLVCSPLRQNRLDLLVEKATELGVARIIPVLLQHSAVRKVNDDRLRAIATEAAEQCGRDSIPEISPLVDAPTLWSQWDAHRPLLLADESGHGAPPATLLPSLQMPLAVCIGPEGGFAPAELQYLRTQPWVRGLSLGPRILRAETAGIAALTATLAWCGDWHEPPRFEAKD